MQRYAPDVSCPMGPLMRNTTSLTLGLWGAIALVGCAGAESGRDGAGPGIGVSDDAGGSGGTDGAGSDEGDEGGGNEGADDDGADDEGGSMLFDVGSNDPGDDPSVDTGCHKIDFLFVIDNSGTMGAYQQQLVGSFPGFIDEIEASTGGGDDYHVMVVDTDAWGRCDTAGWAGYDPGDETCNGYVESTMFDECDRVRGAGVVHPAGVAASNQPCAPAGGHRYMVSGDPDPAATFGCMAQVGTAGHQEELVMDSLRAAISPPLVDAGGCNAGFLRDDALLVIVIIADEADGPGDVDTATSTGGPGDWYDDVVARKSSPDDIVVVSLIHDPAGACAKPEPAFDGGNIAAFTAMFGAQGHIGGICDADYAPVFAQAVGIVDEACDEFEPPG